MKFKITAIQGNPRSWSGKHGPMMSYPIEVIDESGVKEDAEWARKPESAAPQVDMILEADGFWPRRDNAPPDARPVLKGVKVLDAEGNPILASRNDSQPSGGSSGGRMDDPTTQARIARSVAQKCAADFVGHMAAAGVPRGDEMKKWAVAVVEYTEFFEQHLQEAGREQEKQESNGQPATKADSEVPF